MRTFRFLIVLVCSLCTINYTWSQKTYSFLINDGATGLPISDAFIFVENTVIGTATDAVGHGILEIPNGKNFNIVITHVGYKNRTISINSVDYNLEIIELEPNAQQLSNLTITSNKPSSRNRKRWMKTFKEALFGTYFKKKDIKLLNPEVIWFEENDSLLTANSIEMLKIENKATGYEINLLLEQFSIDKNSTIKYEGKLFFNDQLDSYRNQKKISKRRQEIYKQSKRLFFQSLRYQMPFLSDRFEFGLTTAKENAGHHYQPLEFEDLTWRLGEENDTLLVNEFLTVFNKENLKKGRPFKQNTVDQNASFLFPKNGRLIIDDYGRIVNAMEVEELGYWTKFRIPAQLPLGYTGGIKLPRMHERPSIINSLLAHTKKYQYDKVFIHTNQADYNQFERMWIKAYLVNGQSHLPQSLTKVVYVDLINPANEIINTWLLNEDQGLTIDHLWTSNHTPGEYTLRAYTRLMRNSPSAYFFTKKITLFEPSTLVPEVNNTTENDSIIVTFYPEGGDLIANLNSYVTFQVTDAEKKPIEISGILRNGKNEIVTKVNSQHQGVGVFSFAPSIDQEYTLEFTYQGTQLQRKLPRAFPSGMSLNVNNTSEEDIFVKINSNDSTLLEGAFVIGHVRGQIFLYSNNIHQSDIIRISKAEIPQGIIHITLFDKFERPHAERICFNDYATHLQLLEVEESFIDSLNNVTISIRLDSTLLFDPINASVSALSLQHRPAPYDMAGIKSYLLINSDIPYHIPNINYYLEEIDASKRYYLDLLLQCQSWRRFTWRDITEQLASHSNYVAESGYSIEGYTSHLNSEEGIEAEVSLSSLDQNFFYLKTQTDENGKFIFPNIPIRDSMTFMIQGRINKGNKSTNEGRVTGNRLLNINIDPTSSLTVDSSSHLLFELPITPTMVPMQNDVIREKALVDMEVNGVDWRIDLENIEIVAKPDFSDPRPYPGKYFKLDHVDWVPPETQGTQLLSRLAPQYRFALGDEAKLNMLTTNIYGQPTKLPMQIVIDGLGAHPGGSNVNRLLGLTADMIETIYIGKGVINITTRGIPRSREAYLENGIIQYDHPGYYKAREFKEPLHLIQDKQDLRTTLLWNPNLLFDENGEAYLQFRNSNSNLKYQINIEGISQNGRLISYNYISN